ncbi:MAG: hypothetical protein M1830_010700 [Pleopsidium flavum]|nr:MAG: hypothetical protein M1830_010700 [Pleopsidium flavum]
MSSSQQGAFGMPAVPPRLALPPDLLRPCCLRCSKNLGKDPGLTCTRPNQHQKCRRCTRLGKQCSPIPGRFNRLFAGCQRAADASLAAPDDVALGKVLRAKVRSYTRRVSAYLRNVGTKPGQSREDAMLVATQRMANSLELIGNILLHMAHLPPKPGDDEDDNDEDEEESDEE